MNSVRADRACTLASSGGRALRLHHKLDSPHFISFKFGDCLFIWRETFH